MIVRSYLVISQYNIAKRLKWGLDLFRSCSKGSLCIISKTTLIPHKIMVLLKTNITSKHEPVNTEL